MRLLNRPARASAWLLGELLRAEAVALTEAGRLTQGIGSILEETLGGGGRREASENGARSPNDREGAHTTAGAQTETNAMPNGSHGGVRASDVGNTAGRAPLTPLPTIAPPGRRATATPDIGRAERSSERVGHVDEQAVLVSESADPGAQDGAGASVRVQEPWSGYRAMRAAEIVDRLPALPDEVLSLVLLYETKPGRARSTVLRAAQRELERRAA
jgi:hypothetical protein